MREFNLEEAKTGYPVCTRGGRDARIVCFDYKSDFPIIGLIKYDDEEATRFFDLQGRSFGKPSSRFDLMMKD